MKVRCMIVDDQSQSAELLVDHIRKVPMLEVAFVTVNPVEALAFLDSESVDCIFLDVEMPELSGLEFIEMVKHKFGKVMPRVILITAYDQYALKGYDYGVFDYLLKPISFKRFKISVDRLVNSFTQTDVTRDFLFLDVDGKKVKIKFCDIVYIEGAGNYIFIVTEEKRTIFYKSMSSILEHLPSNEFVRVHKSFIVSLPYIDALRGNEILIKSQAGHKSIPIGSTYKENLLSVLRISG